jgi:hypothetical protein
MNAIRAILQERSANFVSSVKTKAMNSHKSAPLKNSEGSSPFEDPIVKEVRDSRHELASRLDNDLQKIAHDLILRQKQLGDRLRVS